jgi:hypothetical protein
MQTYLWQVVQTYLWQVVQTYLWHWQVVQTYLRQVVQNYLRQVVQTYLWQVVQAYLWQVVQVHTYLWQVVHCTGTDLFVGGICRICLGLLRKLEIGIRSGGSTDNTCKNREATFNPSFIIFCNQYAGRRIGAVNSFYQDPVKHFLKNFLYLGSGTYGTYENCL